VFEASHSDLVNIAARLSRTAEMLPEGIAVVEPVRCDAAGRYRYQEISFTELERDSNEIAAGLRAYGVEPGAKLVLMVKPGIDFVSLTFALFKAGVVVVLIDPGMGRKNLLQCLSEINPDGFVALPIVHAVRMATRRRFPSARWNVTVGKRWFWRGKTLQQIRQLGRRHIAERGPFHCTATRSSDPAAIIFTTGSTGPPKGVLYTHGNFDAQVDQIQSQYGIEPGGTDLSAFPLFALFNSGMGTTTVIPDMDPRRPAAVRPQAILQALDDWKITQSFASPAVWNVVGKYCHEKKIRLRTLRRVLSAGAPVPPHVLAWMKQAMPEGGEMHTPYGATESLPIATISAAEVLQETAIESARGAGTCVGRRFSQIQWRVIPVVDHPVEHIDKVDAVPRGQIGELIVKGPVVTRSYITRMDANALAKIPDGDEFWHRMGDVGYLDEQDRFWFCGRKAHRVETAQGVMFTIPCEAIFSQHPSIHRSALVGVGQPGNQIPVMICEPWSDRMPQDDNARQKLRDELFALGQASRLTDVIKLQHVLLHPSLPVDIRHNAKIFREKLAVWAAQQLGVTS
jgi:acyl-CoA synthetase (AMP-forming)/AMP-acid ligase II